MPRDRPPFVELWRDRHKKVRVYFRKDKGPRIPLPGTIGSAEFNEAYQAALTGKPVDIRPAAPRVQAGTIAALIVSYKSSRAYIALRATTKNGYASRLETLRIKHGQRKVSQMTREGIENKILAEYADRPGAQLSLLKMLRILIKHSMGLDKGNPLRLSADPSVGISRPRSKEIRAWTDAECAAFERRWPLGSKQRTAYALMLYVGTARVDAHRMTWTQFDDEAVKYRRSKTGVDVDTAMQAELRAALAAAARDHITIINTAYGRPFTVAGFSGFMRDAMAEAGLPLDCKPHGLRKTLGRRLADAGCTAHEIMAMLGHTTLAEAERYTREADRRRGGRQAVLKLEAHRANAGAQTSSGGLGNARKKRDGSI